MECKVIHSEKPKKSLQTTPPKSKIVQIVCDAEGDLEYLLDDQGHVWARVWNREADMEPWVQIELPRSCQ